MRICLALILMILSTTATAGTWLFIPCKFDSYQPTSITALETRMLQMNGYFTQQSGGKFSPSFTVHPAWVQINPINSYTGSQARFNIARDCVNAANVDLSNVDGIFFGLNRPIFPNSTGGQSFPLELGGITKEWALAWIMPVDITSAATMAHEMGHMLGFNHTDNNDFDNDTYDNEWDLMSYGLSFRGLAGYHRDSVNWIDDERRIEVEGIVDFEVDMVANTDSGEGIEYIRLNLPDGVFTVEVQTIPHRAVVLYHFGPVRGVFTGRMLGTGSGDYHSNILVTVEDAGSAFIVRIKTGEPKIFKDSFE